MPGYRAQASFPFRQIGRTDMHKLLPAILALMLASGAAVAQTATDAAPASPPAALIAPPPGTLATTDDRRVVSPDGTVTDKQETTYRDTAGVANESVTKTMVPAAVAVERSTTTSTATSVTRATTYEHSCPPRNVYDPKTESCVAD